MLVEVGVSNAVEVPGPVCELVAAERHVALVIMPAAVGIEITVAPIAVEIVMPAVAITVPVAVMVPIVVPIMTPIVLVETVTIILVKLIPTAAGDAVVIVDTREMLWF